MTRKYRLYQNFVDLYFISCQYSDWGSEALENSTAVKRKLLRIANSGISDLHNQSKENAIAPWKEMVKIVFNVTAIVKRKRWFGETANVKLLDNKIWCFCKVQQENQEIFIRHR